MTTTLEMLERLGNLLRDPHPGLFTWNDAVGQARGALRDRITEELAPPPVDYAAIARRGGMYLVVPDEGTD